MINEQDLRVDVFRAGYTQLPTVRVTHIPSGMVESVTDRSERRARQEATVALFYRLNESAMDPDVRAAVARVLLSRFPDTPWSKRLIDEVTLEIGVV